MTRLPLTEADVEDLVRLWSHNGETSVVEVIDPAWFRAFDHVLAAAVILTGSRDSWADGFDMLRRIVDVIEAEAGPEPKP